MDPGPLASSAGALPRAAPRPRPGLGGWSPAAVASGRTPAFCGVATALRPQSSPPRRRLGAAGGEGRGLLRARWRFAPAARGARSVGAAVHTVACPRPRVQRRRQLCQQTCSRGHRFPGWLSGGLPAAPFPCGLPCEGGRRGAGGLGRRESPSSSGCADPSEVLT